MKTAEEMLDEHYENLNGNASDIIVAIKQIQLDAMQEGMRRAAGEVRMTARDDKKDAAGNLCAAETAILTVAEQLTEKDL